MAMHLMDTPAARRRMDDWDRRYAKWGGAEAVCEGRLGETLHDWQIVIPNPAGPMIGRRGEGVSWTEVRESLLDLAPVTVHRGSVTVHATCGDVLPVEWPASGEHWLGTEMDAQAQAARHKREAEARRAEREAEEARLEQELEARRPMWEREDRAVEARNRAQAEERERVEAQAAARAFAALRARVEASR